MLAAGTAIRFSLTSTWLLLGKIASSRRLMIHVVMPWCPFHRHRLYEQILPIFMRLFWYPLLLLRTCASRAECLAGLGRSSHSMNTATCVCVYIYIYIYIHMICYIYDVWWNILSIWCMWLLCYVASVSMLLCLRVSVPLCNCVALPPKLAFSPKLVWTPPPQCPVETCVWTEWGHSQDK